MYSSVMNRVSFTESQSYKTRTNNLVDSITNLNTMTPTIVMPIFTTGSCRKCGYQAKPRKHHSADVGIHTCPICDNELT
jgi:predicted Zn-ribbon and HTH transcriptional regulator